MDIKLIKKQGLSNEGVRRLLATNRTETPIVFLFPEYTFSNKFTKDMILELLSTLPLNIGSHLFCSAYELETKEDVDKRIEEYVKVSGGDYSRFNAPLTRVRLFFEPRYFNMGYLVSGRDGANLVSSYKKRIRTTFDSLNGHHGNNIVKTKSSGGSGVIVRTTYDGMNLSKEIVSFPNLLVDDINLEFRICADIECGTENNPEIILVSAHKLYRVYQRTRKSLNGELVIVNDGGRFFAPVGYKNRSVYVTTFGLSMQDKEGGIKVSRI